MQTRVELGREKLLKLFERKIRELQSKRRGIITGKCGALFRLWKERSQIIGI